LIVKSPSDLPAGFRKAPCPSKPITYLVLSDIHLGKKSVPSRFLLAQLRKFFKILEQSLVHRPLDILFLAGDLFDQALSFTSDDIFEILQWQRELLKWCAKNNIRVRVLEGTPSHDRGQPKNLMPLAKSIPHLNFEYIPLMCVEYFEDLGITCLYLPDEFGGSAQNAQALIQQEYDRLGLESTTIAIMHGMFRYQMPDLGSDRFKLDEAFFLNKVETYLNIGHVHIPSTYSRIICQGSFGRLAHGEEHAKGGSLVHLNPNGEHQHFFLENQDATPFVTVKITFNDVDKAAAQLHKKINELPPYSHVRVRASRSHAIFNVLDNFKKEYATVSFSKISHEEAERSQLIDETLLHTDYTPVHLHRDNIVGMVMDKVRQNPLLQGQHLVRLENKLKELT
jgi:hypothetical protein